MNTATLAYTHKRYASVGLQRWSWKVLQPVLLLAVAIIVTAFTLVYFKDLNRRYFIQYQQLQAQQQQQQVHWGQLLLEQSAWSTQSRVQNIAQTKLGMISPKMKNVIMLKAIQPAVTVAPKNSSAGVKKQSIN
jgi:cell division protein FtsL